MELDELDLNQSHTSQASGYCIFTVASVSEAHLLEDLDAQNRFAWRRGC